MRKMLSRTATLLVTLAVVGLTACETKEPQGNNPGALPRSQGGSQDVEPRLSASTYVAHGHLLERQGNLEQAAAQYRRALELTPLADQARTRLGIVLNRLGRHSEATVTFRELVARQPASAQAHNNLGFSLFLEGRTAEAEQMLARATELDPGFRRAHMNRGLALAKLKRYDDALAAFRLSGHEADAYYNLAVVQAEAGLYADAARALEQALIINPDFTAARQDLRTVARMAATQEAAPAPALATPPPTLITRSALPSEALPTDDLTTAGAVEAIAIPIPPTPQPASTPTAAIVDETTQIRAFLGLPDGEPVSTELVTHEGLRTLIEILSTECRRTFLNICDRGDAWVRVHVLLNDRRP
ncbi:MAG: tetratricopeptide repeat protein [Phycisphaerales bacterium]|nr:tetratricopeptide repeat protein [Phycisphaerales bacterium]